MTHFRCLLPPFLSLIFYLHLFSFTKIVSGAFQETPASFLGEIGSKVTLRCSYYQVYERANNQQIRIRIDWLKAEPQLADTQATLAPPFEPFYEDKRRIFIKYARSEGNDLVKNTSTIEIVEVKYEDMGRYKCVINGGKTYGGEESPVAEIKLS